MRVLLIAENRQTTHLAAFPLGAACVAGSLRKAGHEVSVLDMMFLGDWEEKLRAALTDFRPGVISLSIRNLDNQDSRNTVFYLDGLTGIIRSCRERSAAPVVLGGAGFNIHPAGCLQYLGADLGVFGEGEKAFTRLLAALERGESISRLPGAVRMEGGRAVVNPPDFIADLDEWVRPSYDDFEVSSYQDYSSGTMPGCVTVQSKRGCHMKCIYCSTPFTEGTCCRARKIEDVVGEMAYLNERRGIRRFFLADNVFNFPLSNAKDFCRGVIKSGLSIEWQAIMNPAYGDDELFGLMRRAGCVFMSLGNESGAEPVLRNLKKGFTLKKVREMAALARRHDIKYSGFLLLGGPGEDRDTVRRSVEFMEELAPAVVSMKAGIRIYPGTGLEKIAREEEQVAPGQDLLFPAFYMSPAIREWIWDYLDETCRTHERWSV